MAWVRQVLLDDAEAVLFINAVRTTLQYLDTKLNPC